MGTRWGITTWIQKGESLAAGREGAPGAGGRRSNAWRSVVTERSKYIRYLGYELGEAPYEEFYDLERDPGETKNLAGDRAYAGQVEEARRRADYITDHYPAAQMTWATACAADRHII